MFRRVNKKIYLVILMITLTPVFFVFAAGNTTSSSSGLPGIDLTIQDVGNWVTSLACWTIQIVLAIMIIALVVAGVRYFIAGTTGDVASAKKNLTWVLIGIVVILGVNVIIATIDKALGGDYSFLPLSCTGVSTKINPRACATDKECKDRWGAGFQCLPVPDSISGEKTCSAPVK